MEIKFKGTGIALVTPFNSHGEIDPKGFKRLLSHTVGADYWVINGTTGESPVLTEAERNKILHDARNNNPKGLPIMYGIGGNNTQAILQQIKFTDFTSIQAILSVCPYYNKPTQEGLFQHYSAIADHSPVPVYIYNVPGRTSVNIESDTILRLAEHENIHGVKEASPDPGQWKAVGNYKPDDFLLISGDDISTLSIIQNGGSGVISVMGNAFPELMCKMVNCALDGLWHEAEDILDILRPINPFMYQESNPVGVKEALHQLGICEPYVRLPLVKASESLSKQIASLLPTTVA